MMLHCRLIFVDFVQSDEIGILLFNRDFKPLTAGFVCADVISMLGREDKISVFLLWMKGQLDVKYNGIHLECVLDKGWVREK